VLDWHGWGEERGETCIATLYLPLVAIAVFEKREKRSNIVLDLQHVGTGGGGGRRTARCGARCGRRASASVHLADPHTCGKA
jgi:hypothetical protein